MRPMKKRNTALNTATCCLVTCMAAGLATIGIALGAVGLAASARLAKFI